MVDEQLILGTLMPREAQGSSEGEEEKALPPVGGRRGIPDGHPGIPGEARSDGRGGPAGIVHDGLRDRDGGTDLPGGTGTGEGLDAEPGSKPGEGMDAELVSKPGEGLEPPAESGREESTDPEEGPETEPGMLDRPGCDDDACVSIPVPVLGKHMVILGASGSGKTVLGKVVVEEATIQGIPSIVIDPQGDLASLGRMGVRGTVEAKGTSAVSYANYLNRAEVRIFTPASSKGIPLSINPLKRPPDDLPPEEAIKALDLVCEGLVRVLGYRPGSPEGKASRNFLFSLIKKIWERGIPLGDFSAMSSLVSDPGPVGMTNPTSLITDRERVTLAKNLNYLSIGVDQLLFNFGIPVDMGVFLRPCDPGRVPVNVIYLNTLSSEEHKQFFVAMIAREIYTYMLRNPMKGVQLLFLVDEVAPYLPPHPNKPPAKEMLKLLFKQGRKYGVSCVMCTQNPADVDYKAMAQANTWALGRMMAKQDLDKVRPIMGSRLLTRRSDLTSRLPRLGPGEFIFFSPDVFREPVEFKVRYLITEHVTLEEEALAESIPKGMKAYFEDLMVAMREGDATATDVECAEDAVSGPDSRHHHGSIDSGSVPDTRGKKRRGETWEKGDGMHGGRKGDGSQKDGTASGSKERGRDLDAKGSGRDARSRTTTREERGKATGPLTLTDLAPDTPIPRGSILMLSIAIPQTEIVKESNRRLRGTILKKETIEEVRLVLMPLWRVGFDARDYVGRLKIPFIGKQEVQRFHTYLHGKTGKFLDMPDKSSPLIPLAKDEPASFSDIGQKDPMRPDIFMETKVVIERACDLPVAAPRFTFSEDKVGRKMESTFGATPENIRKLLLPVWVITIKDKEFKERRSLIFDAVFGRDIQLE